MNIKAAYQYQVEEHRSSVIMYYIILLCVLVFSFTLIGISNSKDVGSSGFQFNGMELVTGIFVFIAGMCSFKENLGMLVQNSVSRKSLMIGRILTTATWSFVMAIIDIIIPKLFIFIMSLTGETFSSGETMMKIIYGSRVNVFNGFSLYIVSVIFSMSLYMVLAGAGYLIAIIFYKLGRMGKIMIGAGLPITILVVLPVLDLEVFSGQLSEFYWDICYIYISTYSIGAHVGIIINLVLFALASVVAWLLMRRAVVYN